MSIFKSLRTRTITATILLSIIAASFLLHIPALLVALVTALWLMIAIDEWHRFNLSTALFLIYPTLSVITLIILTLNYEAALLYLLLTICSHDTGAYFVGHLWGTHKLAPHISPGKTWEGFFGGVIVSYLTIACWFLITNPPISLFMLVILTGALNIAGVLGDLFESYLKRRVGLKDSGALLPGHGGALDRLDSLLFAAPVLLLYLWLFGSNL